MLNVRTILGGAGKPSPHAIGAFNMIRLPDAFRNGHSSRIDDYKMNESGYVGATTSQGSEPKSDGTVKTSVSKRISVSLQSDRMTFYYQDTLVNITVETECHTSLA